jgi:hypothetical protein
MISTSAGAGARARIALGRNSTSTSACGSAQEVGHRKRRVTVGNVDAGRIELTRRRPTWIADVDLVELGADVEASGSSASMTGGQHWLADLGAAPRPTPSAGP